MIHTTTQKSRFFQKIATKFKNVDSIKDYYQSNVKLLKWPYSSKSKKARALNPKLIDQNLVFIEFH